MACARSSAQRSATSATTIIVEASRRASVQTVQGFCVSILPQILQTSIFSIAVCKAAASGPITASRFLIKNSAARRADRGPSPGRRASNWIRRSISGPAAIAGMATFSSPPRRGRENRRRGSERAAAASKQLQPRRQRQPASERLHALLQQHLELAARVRVRGDDQVLNNVFLVRLEQRLVKLGYPHFALAGKLQRQQSAAGNAFDFDAVEFRLHRFHFRLELSRLFHQPEKISHDAPAYLKVVVGTAGFTGLLERQFVRCAAA